MRLRDPSSDEARDEKPAGLQTRGFERYAVSLIVVSGERAGDEHAVEQPRCLLGRGPAVDVVLDDPGLDAEHALIEFARGSFRVRNLGSQGGTRVNGSAVERSELLHGDRLEIGSQVFQLLIDLRAAA